MPRGGARKNPGRKQAVPWPDLREIAGAHCEGLWEQRTDEILKQRIEKLTKPVREIQERTQAINLNRRPTATDRLQEVTDDLDVEIYWRHHPRLFTDLLSLENAGYGPLELGVSRVVTVKRTRPKGEKAAVIAQAIEWVAEHYKEDKTGKPIVLSAYRMRRCWDEWRRKNRHSLNSHDN